MGCRVSIECGRGDADVIDPSGVAVGVGGGHAVDMRPNSSRLKAVANEGLLLDAHCHYLNYLQQTEGLEVLAEEMAKNKVGFAVLMGTPFKKSYIAQDQPPPQHHLYDDGDLYHYSMTDGLLMADMRSCASRLGSAFTSRFGVSACGFNLGDMGVGAEAKRMLETYPCIGLGEMTLQSDDINNMTLKGSNWTYGDPAIAQLLDVCAKQEFPRKPIPFIFLSDARSISTKPYRQMFEYVEQIEAVVAKQPGVKCLWVNAGVFGRGQWKEYAQVSPPCSWRGLVGGEVFGELHLKLASRTTHVPVLRMGIRSGARARPPARCPPRARVRRPLTVAPMPPVQPPPPLSVCPSACLPGARGSP